MKNIMIRFLNLQKHTINYLLPINLFLILDQFAQSYTFSELQYGRKILQNSVIDS